MLWTTQLVDGSQDSELGRLAWSPHYGVMLQLVDVGEAAVTIYT